MRTKLIHRSKNIWRALAMALAAAALQAQAAPLGEGGKPRIPPRLEAEAASARVIVKYRANAAILASDIKKALSVDAGISGPQTAATLGQRLGLALSDGRALGSRSQVLHGQGLSSRALVEKLAQQADVEWVVEDQRRFALAAPNDPLYADNQTGSTPAAGQWYLRAPTGSVVSAINAEGAWAITQGSASIVVAILDTGIIKSHPDLSSKLLAGYDFISNIATANDGNGRDSDPSDPGDWITAAEDASGTFKGCGAEDSSWHGTRVASIVGAATNNGIGMAGTAPNAPLLPVRVLGKCGGYDSDIQAAMLWSAGIAVPGVSSNANPARVINMSLGSSGSCNAAYQDVVNQLAAAKVVVVAAAGNEGLAVGTPASCSGVVAVAGVRHAGTKVGYSSLGPEVAIAAPAGNCVNLDGQCLYPITAATNTGSTSPVGSSYTDGSNYNVGTSFAVPQVAGTVALMLAANSALTPGEVTSLLKSTARSFPSSGADAGVGTCQAPSGVAQNSECYCTTSTCGAGMLDAAAAVQAAAATALPTAVIASSASRVLAGETVTLDGSGSSAAGGRSIAAYRWSIIGGVGLASISGSSTASSVTLSAGAEGTVTVQLTVTDSLGQTATQSSSFAIAAGRPTAAFSASTSTPSAGSTVTLDGTASSAKGSARISAYQWEITSGASLASFSGATNASTATLAASAAGAVTVTLTVTDSNGYTASSSQTLTIGAANGGSGTTSSGSSSGGGGGAMSGLWLIGLLLAALALPGRARRR